MKQIIRDTKDSGIISIGCYHHECLKDNNVLSLHLLLWKTHVVPDFPLQWQLFLLLTLINNDLVISRHNETAKILSVQRTCPTLFLI